MSDAVKVLPAASSHVGIEAAGSFEIPRPSRARGVGDSLRARLIGPRTLLTGLGIVRRLRPVLRIGSTFVVTRHADVVDVLRRPDEFCVEATNGQKMDALDTTFILGMDRGASYDRERAWLNAALQPFDGTKLRADVRSWAGELLDAAAGRGVIDVCGEYARTVGARLVQAHLGVPGPDTGTLMRWMRALFRDLFLDLSGSEAVHREAMQAARDLSGYLTDLIEVRRAAASASQRPEDLLGRLVHASEFRSHDPAGRGLDADGIRRSISGVIVGAVDTTNKSFCFALDQLFRHRSGLALAIEAARDDDAEALRDLFYEALRFNPHNPIVLRHCPEWAVIAHGTKRATPVPPGSRIFAATFSAMFDELVLDAPKEFLAGRTTGHLQFGDGMHRCFGEPMNDIVLPELLGALLRRSDVRRAGPLRGRMHWDGPFPDRMDVRFG